jgi:hypothetical protein
LVGSEYLVTRSCLDRIKYGSSLFPVTDQKGIRVYNDSDFKDVKNSLVHLGSKFKFARSLNSPDLSTRSVFGISLIKVISLLLISFKLSRLKLFHICFV